MNLTYEYWFVTARNIYESAKLYGHDFEEGVVREAANAAHNSNNRAEAKDALLAAFERNKILAWDGIPYG